MSKKNFSTKAGNIFLLSIFFAIFAFAGLAHASGSDSKTFLNNPSIVGTTSPYVWPSTLDVNGNYTRNIYWNFNTNPFTSSPQNAVYYGGKDRETASGSTYSGDSFTNTGSVAWTGATTQQIGYATTGMDSTGTAVYTFTGSNLKDTSNMLYIWAEINVTTTGKSANNVMFSGLTGGTIEASEIFLGGVEQAKATTSTTSGAFDFAMTGTNVVYDAYFAVLNPTTDALTLTFNQGTDNGHEGTALVNSLHIAMTPEPISMALFATGVAVLFFFRRRRLALA